MMMMIMKMMMIDESENETKHCGILMREICIMWKTIIKMKKIMLITPVMVIEPVEQQSGEKIRVESK